MRTHLILGLAALLLLPATAAGAGQWCHDPARDTVAPAVPGNCAGKLIDDAEAERVRGRRLDQIRRAMGGGPPPPGAQAGQPGSAPRRMISIGTGFFITADGKMLSNNHVVERCAEITVDTAEARGLPARVVATAPKDDLALIDTAAPPPAFASFRSGAMPVAGTDVALVGYPNRGLAPVQPLLTQGTLMGTDRPQPVSAGGVGPRLAFKADVRHGNSGGPLFDSGGLVIGVVFAKQDSPKTYRETGRVIIDVGFAISAPVATTFVERHGVKLTGRPPQAGVGADDLLATATRLVARVNCWQ